MTVPTTPAVAVQGERAQAHDMPVRGLRRLPWPLPAALAWAGAWAAWAMLGAAGAGGTVALTGGLLIGLGLAWPNAGAWRRLIAAAGFPLSALALGGVSGGASAWPPWLWLLLLLPLLAAYPLRAWRDAPFFPTPADALEGLAQVLPAPPQRVLDAGCGLGHGLAALHRLWPQAELHGIEFSPLLALAGAWRCGYARVRRADMWAASWAGHDLVYLFQRPESMARAWQKAQAELSPGAWLVSLEFPVPGQEPNACLEGAGRRPLWVYATPAPGANSNKAAPRR